LPSLFQEVFGERVWVIAIVTTFISLFGKKPLVIGYALALSELVIRPVNAEQYRSWWRYYSSLNEIHFAQALALLLKKGLLARLAIPPWLN